MNNKEIVHDERLLRAMFRVSGITARDMSVILGYDPVYILDWAIGNNSLPARIIDGLALLLGLHSGDIEGRIYYMTVGNELSHLATVIGRTAIYRQGFRLEEFKIQGRPIVSIISGETRLVIKRAHGTNKPITIESLIFDSDILGG